MKADQIMDALGRVKDTYVMEAMPCKKKAKKTSLRWIAAVLAILIMVLAFFQTAPSAAAIEMVKDAVTSFIEMLFPPKDIPVNVEGMTEDIHHEAGGLAPEVQEDGTVQTPGFAIYYDTERYVMSEENGVTYIRFIAENDLPPCEVEIAHIPNAAPAEAAAAAKEQMGEQWENLSEITALEYKDGVHFWVSEGSNWDSACEDVYFLSDGATGSFQITARYFIEATEGHGVRFSQMVKAFEVIS